MSGSSSFGKAPKNDGVEKAREPVGSKIKPERWNGAANTDTVGGFGDAAAPANQRMAGTARRGSGAGAAKTTESPTMTPPTPYPGQKGKAKPNPLAPTSLRQSSMAKGSSQGRSGEAAGRAMANVARKGNVKLPMNPTRHQQAVLPAPTPSFPKATGPAGKPVPAPNTSGKMTGAIQGRKGVNPGQSSLKS